MTARLLVTAGPNRGAQFQLTDRIIFNIGSDRSSTVFLDDPKVSPNHCRLYKEDLKFTLFDVSGKGLAVNGKKVVKAVLAENDIIRIGDSELRFSSADDAPAPPAPAAGYGVAPAPPAAAYAPPGGPGPYGAPPPAYAPPPAPAAAPGAQQDFRMPLPADTREPRGYTRVWLQCVEGNDKGKTFDLSEGNVWVIGRGHSADITVMDIKVSRAHCRIDRQGNTFYLNDLNSTNGTFLNGQQIDRQVLHRGDYIKVGYTILAFQYETPEESSPARGSAPAHPQAAPYAAPAPAHGPHAPQHAPPAAMAPGYAGAGDPFAPAPAPAAAHAPYGAPPAPPPWAPAAPPPAAAPPAWGAPPPPAPPPPAPPAPAGPPVPEGSARGRPNETARRRMGSFALPEDSPRDDELKAQKLLDYQEVDRNAGDSAAIRALASGGGSAPSGITPPPGRQGPEPGATAFGGAPAPGATAPPAYRAPGFPSPFAPPSPPAPSAGDDDLDLDMGALDAVADDPFGRPPGPAAGSFAPAAPPPPPYAHPSAPPPACAPHAAAPALPAQPAPAALAPGAPHQPPAALPPGHGGTAPSLPAFEPPGQEVPGQKVFRTADMAVPNLDDEDLFGEARGAPPGGSPAAPASPYGQPSGAAAPPQGYGAAPPAYGAPSAPPPSGYGTPGKPAPPVKKTVVFGGPTPGGEEEIDSLIQGIDLDDDRDGAPAASGERKHKTGELPVSGYLVKGGPAPPPIPSERNAPLQCFLCQRPFSPDDLRGQRYRRIKEHYYCLACCQGF